MLRRDLQIEAAFSEDQWREYRTTEAALIHSFPREGHAQRATLTVVVHGMMGQGGGLIPAETVLDAMRKAVEEAPVDQDVGEILVRALQSAHAELDERTRRNPFWGQMGASVAAGLFLGRQVALLQLGDCRIYRLQGDVIEQLSEDDTLLAEILRSGKSLTSEEASQVPDVLVRCLGFGSSVSRVRTIEVAPGDVLLFCTRGLHTVLDSAEIHHVLRSNTSPAEACAALNKQAIVLGHARPRPLSCDEVTTLVAHAS